MMNRHRNSLRWVSISSIVAWSTVFLFLLSFSRASFSQPSEDALKKLDPLAQHFHVDALLKRIHSVPYDPDKGFSFVAWGDIRSNPDVFKRLWTEIQKEDALFAITTGDLVRRGKVNEWLEYFSPVITKYNQVPFLPVIGNHDLGVFKKRVEYKRIFGKTEYTFDYGNARFIVLDNNDGLTEKQLGWLERLLQEAGDKLKFVIAHKPPDTIRKWAYHSFSDNADRFCDLLSKYHVDTVFLGHIHAYSTAKRGNVEYVITGGGGAGLHSRYGPMGNVHHYCVVHVKGTKTYHEVVRLIDGKITRSPGGNDFYQHPRQLLNPKILTVLKKSFPNSEIYDVEIDKSDGQQLFQVELDDRSGPKTREIKVDLQKDGTVLKIQREVFLDELPQSILTFLHQKYPKDKFDEAAKTEEKGEEPYYEVTLIDTSGNDRDLLFSLHGEFMKED